MTCRFVLDTLLGSGGKPPNPFIRLAAAAHLFFCPRCGERAALFREARDLLGRDFFPPAPPCLEAAVMERIAAEPASAFNAPPEKSEFGQPVPFRSWVITGCVILISLATAFFGIDFIQVSAVSGSSFLIPVGITIGVIITGYGALFIGSHLKEFSERFGLR
ncbi:MAG: peptidoglycan-binding protein [Treponema sp.]|jgi:hypothetical protein|nr:peptidoglycan-binding protein [Treponema sp.]